mmetsp:Transcript_38201/g.93880  ORF Transcript_38201/g.93880 Transcript_38201/m.93880 type:complete len:205 (-) Transcript_38201:541-1155(-)
MRSPRRSAGRPVSSRRTRRERQPMRASPTSPSSSLLWVSTWRLRASSSRTSRRTARWRTRSSSSTSPTTPPSSASSPPVSPSPPPSTSPTSATSTCSSSSPTCRRTPTPCARCRPPARRCRVAVATPVTCTLTWPRSTSVRGAWRAATGPSPRSLCSRCPTTTSRTPSPTSRGTSRRGRFTSTGSCTTVRCTPPSTCSRRSRAL